LPPSLRVLLCDAQGASVADECLVGLVGAAGAAGSTGEEKVPVRWVVP
jgi:hypothetical protein